MSVPTPPAQTSLSIQSAITANGVCKVTLADGTILWVPIDAGNNDYLHVQAWALANNVSL